jgi:hypothetical protein
MDSVGTFIYCWNTLEHPGAIILKIRLIVGTLNVFRSLLERSNNILTH